MYNVLLIIHVIIAITLVAMVLIQRSDNDGFGLGSGGGNPLMSSRGTADFFTRGTAVLATLFILTSLTLSRLNTDNTSSSLADRVSHEEVVPAAVETPPVPATPSVPKAE
jgi:preprotein translocase subunit SecG